MSCWKQQDVLQGDKRTYVKFHWHCDQGVENLTADEAVQVGGTSQSHATTDLYEAIEEGDFPSWTLKVQLMDPADEVHTSPHVMGHSECCWGVQMMCCVASTWPNRRTADLFC